MITLWQRMADLYGHRWLSAYGESTLLVEGAPDRLSPTVGTWQRVLRGITPDELGAGIRACIDRAEEWPPSAGQFRQRCRPRREPYERAEFQGNALPLHPAEPATAQSHINALRNRIAPTAGNE
jgi:hypothetical protein